MHNCRADGESTKAPTAAATKAPNPSEINIQQSHQFPSLSQQQCKDSRVIYIHLLGERHDCLRFDLSNHVHRRTGMNSMVVDPWWPCKAEILTFICQVGTVCRINR